MVFFNSSSLSTHLMQFHDAWRKLDIFEDILAEYVCACVCVCVCYRQSLALKKKSLPFKRFCLSLPCRVEIIGHLGGEAAKRFFLTEGQIVIYSKS